MRGIEVTTKLEGQRAGRKRQKLGLILCKDISQHLSDIDNEAFGRSSGELGW